MPRAARKPDPPGVGRYDAAAQRYLAVRQLADAGKRQCEIARALLLAPRRVRWILNNPIEPVTVPEFPQVANVTFAKIAGFDGYAVGDDGSVWSSHTKSFHRKPGWYPVKVHLPDAHSRYCRVNIRANAGRGRACVRYVHALVLNAFVGPCPAGMECRHGDGDPRNNRLDNLCWGTRSENQEDKRRHGTMPLGSKHKNSKLTEDDVRESRRLRAAGWTQKRRAGKFGVSQSIIGRIDRGEGWTHVV